MANPQEGPKTYKIVVLGDGGVGKSCLTWRFIHDQFLEKYDPTIDDAYRKDNFHVDGELCPLEICDTAGQDQFAATRDLYYKTGDGFLLCYSLVDEKTVDAVTERFNAMKFAKNIQDSPDECPPVTIVGTKVDLCDDEGKREVSTESGEKLAAEFADSFDKRPLKPETKLPKKAKQGQEPANLGPDVTYIETSAKSNKNIEGVFQDIVRRIKQKERMEEERRKSKNGEGCKCTLI